MTLRHRLLPATVTVALLAVAAPCTADACWDGVYVETDKVSIAIETSEVAWSPERARSYAKWAGRIAALVPEGTTVSVEHGFITVCDATTETCQDIERTWDDAHLFNLFELTADVMGASRTTIAHARRTSVELLTVQVAATRDLGAAWRVAQSINEAELSVGGFLDVGGFPSVNESAHVVESWSDELPIYNVVVGSFLDRDDAEAASVAVHEAVGLDGFVRVLDQSSVGEPGC